MKHLSLPHFANCTVFLKQIVVSLARALAIFLAVGHSTSYAQPVAISTVPIFATTAQSNEVKPNVMFVMDDSGSMSWDYMPDMAGNFQGFYGANSAQCNGVYYDPTISYPPPVNYLGVPFANSVFTNAANDVYGTMGGSVDLSRNFVSYIGAWDNQPAYYYTYSGTQTSQRLKTYYDTNSIFYRECMSTVGSTTKVDGTHPVNTLFTKVIVSATSGAVAAGMPADERTNFANWYSMYRTRLQMMKTTSGLAMSNLNQHFRVGFMTINNNTGSDILPINDLTSTGTGSQKQNLFTRLYATQANNSTPLREALSTAGRMYAGRMTAINGTTITDPVQYSCQQNYTVLSTDGFWNGNDNQVFKVDGTTVMDNQDGALPRPYYDGSNVTVTTVTPYTSTRQIQTTTTVPTRTITWTQNRSTIGASCTSGGIPAGAATYPMTVDSGSHTGGLAVSTSNPDGSRCFALTLNGVSDNVWFCRGTGGSAPVSAARNATVTGNKNGVSPHQTWYLVSTGATASGCVTSQAAFGSNGSYSGLNGVCPGNSVSGNYVTTTPYTQTEVISGYNSVSVDLWTANQSTTQVTSNGTVGATGPLTPANPTFTLTSNISQSVTSSTDTCAGVATTCPNYAGNWTAGTASSPVCTATANLPATTPSGGSTPPATITNTVNSSAGTSTSTLSTSGPTAGTPNVTTVASGGTSDTLADVAAYYYNTNLRTTALNNCTGPIIAPATTNSNLCTPNTVPSFGMDTATWQHMTTFTVGLGTRGRMVYSKTYLTDVSVSGAPSDYYDVAHGTTVSSTNCTWLSSGPCYWPVPTADNLTAVDDLWHAAVNGHGTYYAANNPQDLSNGLTSVLNTIINTPQPGSASASATTNPKVTASSDYQFSTYFKTVEWSGELIRQTMNLADGSVPAYNPAAPDPTTYDWSAQIQLDALARTPANGYTRRNIYTNGGTVQAPSLIPFTWTSLSTANLTGYFTAPNITTSPPQYPTIMTGLSQFCSPGNNCINSAAQTATTVATNGASGEALVNFLRGDQSNEEGYNTPNPAKFYRYRAHVLGDIVSAQPQYVGPPSQYLNDAGYSDFKTLYASRAPVVFSAANDGMLHAFDVATGNENWAYIPSFQLPRLYTLADKNYSNLHQYFVDGTPATADICPSAPCTGSQWKTILVGGFNGGGTGYYALDVTNPTTPRLLWEFTDANMGFTYGKPQIAKLDDGTWVVILTSGYNNCPRSSSTNCTRSGTGNGLGYLYVLNANTGAQIASTPIPTTAGSASAPSGLAQVIAQVDPSDVTSRIYGGDLLGNLWRFNVGSAGYSAQLLATLKDSSGNAQPVMSRPQVATVNGSPVVFVGTGRYLSTSDVGSTAQQSFYAIKDPLTATSYGNVRNNTSFISQSASSSTCPTGASIAVCAPGAIVRTVTQNNGNTSSNLINSSGWYLDFPSSSGEIEFTDPKLVLGTLIFSTSVPKASTSVPCAPRSSGSDGDALVYELGYLSGTAIGNAYGVIAVTLGTGIATAPQVSQLANGAVIAKIRLSTGTEYSNPVNISAPTSTKRVAWRELIN